MSLIIKGLDMPTEKEAVRYIAISCDGTVSKVVPTGRFYLTDFGDNKKPKAIPIPTPHGRLIDENELTEHSWDDGYDLYVYWQYIDKAPTILEAEE